MGGYLLSSSIKLLRLRSAKGAGAIEQKTNYDCPLFQAGAVGKEKLGLEAK
jgi:hypothetical protein